MVRMVHVNIFCRIGLQTTDPTSNFFDEQSQVKACIKPKITNGTAGLSKMSRGKSIMRTEPQNCFQTFFPSLKGTVGEKKLEMKIVIFSAYANATFACMSGEYNQCGGAVGGRGS